MLTDTRTALNSSLWSLSSIVTNTETGRTYTLGTNTVTHVEVQNLVMTRNTGPANKTTTTIGRQSPSGHKRTWSCETA